MINVKISKAQRMCLSTILPVLLMSLLLLGSCGNDPAEPEPEPEPEPTDTVAVLDPKEVDTTGFYIPVELRKNNFYRSNHAWYHGRSKASEHFIVFWGKGYGDKDPGSPDVPEAYRVDIDDLLEKAEQFYAININELKFAETGVGKSNLDKYKMLIFIYYQTDWLATGSGYDDKIGALWVSPSTCKPVGSTIAHEIGHSFQYQVFCDLGGLAGFRYGFGGNGGNGFWEQTAQWQSYQSYPQEAFESYNFQVYAENHFRHVCHEWQRYASYFMHYYWADKHGKDFIGKLWRQAQQPEDPIQAYMRITGINVDALNAEVYDAATKFVTWDIDALRQNGADHIGAQSFKSTRLEDGSNQVSYDRCPGTTGYNVIRLNVPEAGTVVSTAFTGLVNESGFNTVANPGRAGWRYGYVALKNDGTRVYGDMNSGTTNTVAFTVPENCSKLWFVVTGAPNTYAPHPWDEEESNDDQWPYKVKFSNTNLYGDIVFDGTEIPADVTLNFNVKFPFSATDYPGTTAVVEGDNLVKLAKAFVLQPSEISSAMDTKIKFYAVESNGTLNATTTANGYGHWYNAGGNVIGWGTEAMVYSEFDATNRTFGIGQYPGHCKAGDTFTIKQALVYEHKPGEKVQATFVFNITIE
jgi:hypothetical protein